MSSSSRSLTRLEEVRARANGARQRARTALERTRTAVEASRAICEETRRLLGMTEGCWPMTLKPCYEELSRVDWLPSMAFAMGARAADASDLGPQERWVLEQIAGRLDAIAEEAGLVAAASAHDQVIAIFATASRGTLH